MVEKPHRSRYGDITLLAGMDYPIKNDQGFTGEERFGQARRHRKLSVACPVRAGVRTMAHDLLKGAAISFFS